MIRRRLPQLVLGVFDFSFQNGDVINNSNIGTITINNGGTGTGYWLRGIRAQRHSRP